MLDYYQKLTGRSEYLLNKLLDRRLKRGKEDAARLGERRGKASLPRPKGKLIWIHAASVGEAQSTLILIDRISKEVTDAHFMVTSGTVTSANLMATRLPQNAFHQFYPLDHPQWVEDFLNHWQPDLILWMESELWPNMLRHIKTKNIPAILINARLSDKSYRIWKFVSGTASSLLSTFSLILSQTTTDEKRFTNLGATAVTTTDNIKYSATPLPYQDNDLNAFNDSIKNRPTWVFASTHDGEEHLACDIHNALSKTLPDLLTIIVPRHPERRIEIKDTCDTTNLETTFRGDNKNLPTAQTQIYVADTLGELGLFYKATEIAVIGRSFSNDGGGGHNPIEAAQLGCAVLTGPNIQFQTQLFEEMFTQNAAYQADNKDALVNQINRLMHDKNIRQTYIDNALAFSQNKTNVIERVMKNLTPFVLALENSPKGKNNAA